jgi:hypothetical protein
VGVSSLSLSLSRSLCLHFWFYISMLTNLPTFVAVCSCHPAKGLRIMKGSIRS